MSAILKCQHNEPVGGCAVCDGTGQDDPLAQYDAAIQTVTQQRSANYGHPSVNFDRAQRLCAVAAECEDPNAREALEMILRKVARLISTPRHLDSWVDIAGYARCGVMVMNGKAVR